MQNLRKVELDEIEALLQLLGQMQNIDDMTCDQIASEIQSRFQVECSGEEIFLLHEPGVYDVWYENTYYYKNILGL